jgi:hypothetical protein
MITNHNREPFFISLDTDNTAVSISSGVMQIGQNVLAFDGTRIPYTSMTSLYGNTKMYQNVALCFKPYPAINATNLDMTCLKTDMTAVPQLLNYPSTPDSSSRALGVFTFQNPDGTVSILSYSKVI